MTQGWGGWRSVPRSLIRVIRAIRVIRNGVKGRNAAKISGLIIFLRRIRTTAGRVLDLLSAVCAAV